MGVGSRRNQPCWCGSGRKFKRCHIDRERQPIAKPYEQFEAARSIFAGKSCFAEGIAGPCGGRIIASHTLARSWLQNIAQRGHVVAPALDPSTPYRTGGHIDFKEKGVSLVSVFNGFCKQHDNDLFSPIETRTFTGGSEQCLLLFVRALARELHTKSAQVDLYNTQVRFADRGKSLVEQVEIQSFVADSLYGCSLGLRDLGREFERATTALRRNAFSEYDSLIVELDCLYPIAATGAFFPEHDFLGTSLQELGDPSGLELLAVSLLPLARSDGQARSVLVLSWHESSGTAKAVAESLRSVPSEDFLTTLANFVIEAFENLAIDPSWWRSLSDEARSNLVESFQTGMPSYHRKPKRLARLPFTSAAVSMRCSDAPGRSV